MHALLKNISKFFKNKVAIIMDNFGIFHHHDIIIRTTHLFQWTSKYKFPLPLVVAHFKIGKQTIDRYLEAWSVWVGLAPSVKLYHPTIIVVTTSINSKISLDKE